mgnify:CR=1 FL=1
MASGELVLLAVVALVLLAANKIPTFMKGVGQGIKEFKKASEQVDHDLGKSVGGAFSVPVGEAITPDNQTAEFVDEPPFGLWKFTKRIKDRLIVRIAQGFGVGRIPFVPGTFGSLVGLVWFGGLLIPRSFEFYFFGMLAGFALSVLICGEAEKILKQKDPGSIVLDEIVAIPLCFLCVIGDGRPDSMPTVYDVFLWDGRIGLPRTLLIFAAFRLFDIWKPWPVRQSQSQPGGWGVTADDVLAAVYVNLVAWLLGATHSM